MDGDSHNSQALSQEDTHTLGDNAVPGSDTIEGFLSLGNRIGVEDLKPTVLDILVPSIGLLHNHENTAIRSWARAWWSIWKQNLTDIIKKGDCSACNDDDFCRAFARMNTMTQVVGSTFEAMISTSAPAARLVKIYSTMQVYGAHQEDGSSLYQLLMPTTKSAPYSKHLDQFLTKEAEKLLEETMSGVTSQEMQQMTQEILRETPSEIDSQELQETIMRRKLRQIQAQCLQFQLSSRKADQQYYELQFRVDELTRDRSLLEQTVDNVQEERLQLQSDCDRVKQDCDRMKQEMCKLSKNAERDQKTKRAQHDRITTLQNSTTEAIEKRKAQEMLAAKLSAENDRFQLEIKVLKTEKKAADADLVRYKEKAKDRNSYMEAYEQLKTEMENKAREHQRTRIQLSDTENELQETQLTATKLEDTLQSKLRANNEVLENALHEKEAKLRNALADIHRLEQKNKMRDGEARPILKPPDNAESEKPAGFIENRIQHGPISLPVNLEDDIQRSLGIGMRNMVLNQGSTAAAPEVTEHFPRLESAVLENTNRPLPYTIREAKQKKRGKR